MTKAFDTALFVPQADPDIGQAVGAGQVGPPFESDWYYYVIAPGPGITLGASVPPATDAGQILLSGPGPGFTWMTAYQLYLGALPTFPSTNPAPGAPLVPVQGSMFFNTSDGTPYILTNTTGNSILDWTPLPTAGTNRVRVDASLPAATGAGQMLIAGGVPNGGVYPWTSSPGMFLGAHPTPPLPIPPAASIPVGGIYYNTTNGQIYVWTGSGWKSLSAPNKAATATLYYQSIANQTDFVTTTNDLFGTTHTFDPLAPEEVEVHLNGVLLMPDGSSAPGDFTVDLTTSTITLTTAPPTGAILAIDVMQDPLSLSPTLVLLEKINPLTFDGTTTTFPLILSTGKGFVASDPTDLHVLLDGVEQEPGVDFVLNTSGDSIIFATAPTPDQHEWIIYYAKSKQGFLTSVEHDGTLSGAGTVPSPLSVVPATTTQRGAVFIPGLADVPPSNLTINALNGKLGATVALQTQIQAGVDNVQPVTPLTLRGVMGLPVTSLVTVAKTVVPAINELFSGQLYKGIWRVASNTPDITPPLVGAIGNWTWVASTVNPQVAETAPAALPGIGGQLVDSGDHIVWTGATYIIVRGSSINFATSELRYVNVTGDTMTGPLIQAADPVAALGTATKQYVDAQDALKVAKAGDTMSGPLILNADPTVPLGAVTKQYADNTFVDTAGDTMTGFLVLSADPLLPLQAATKEYVDVAIASHVLYQGTWQVAANVPDLHVPPNAPLNGYSYTAVTAVPGTPENAPAGIPGIAGLSINTGDTIQWNGGSSQWQLIAGSSLSIVQGDARYVNISGDTMTGTFTLAADPTLALQAATKQYVDTADALNVKKAGDTMTGQLITITPVVAGDAANKGYVDTQDALNVKKAGDTMTGDLVLPAASPVTPASAVPKSYVDAADLLNVKKAGDTMTGPLIQAADPTLPLGTATKQYVDTQDALKVAKAGDTMTGLLVLSGDPTAPLGAATKQYADLSVKKAGDTMTGQLTLPVTAPVGNQDATTKLYVDQAIASGNLYQGQWNVAPNTPDLTPAVANPQNGYSWIAQTVDPNVAETAPAGLPGISGDLIFNGDTIKWSQVALQYVQIQGSSLTIAQADTRYVQLAGSTMTGYLLLNADPVAANGAATKNYVDVLAANAVQKAGDTMTGMLTLPITHPTLPEEAANKDYVDFAVATNSLYQGAYTVATNTPDLTAVTPLNGYSWITQTADPQVPEPTVVALPGIPLGTVVDAGWTIKYNGGTAQFELIKGPDISLTTASGLFVDVTGDTMTGELIFSDDGEGVTFNGGGRFYKAVGTGLVIREHAGGTQPQIEDNNGANRRDILDAVGNQLIAGTDSFLTLSTRNGNAGPPGATAIMFGYGNQSLAGPMPTWRHEIRTSHAGNANDTMEFWINNGAGAGAAPNINPFTISGAQLTCNKSVFIAPAANLTFGTQQAANPGDNSKHIQLYSTAPNIGINVTSGRVNYNHNAATDTHWFRTGNADQLGISNTITANAWFNPAITVGNVGNGVNALVIRSSQNANNAVGGQIEWQASDGRAGAKFYSVQMSTATQYGGHENNLTAYQFCGGFSYRRLWYGTVASPPNFNVEGKMYTGGTLVTSDAALKENIRPVERNEVAQAFAALKPVRFHRKPGKIYNPLSPTRFSYTADSDPDRIEWGFLAQDIEQGAPDLVAIQQRITHMDGEGKAIEDPPVEEVKHYDLGQLVAILTAKVSEQDEQIKQLQEIVLLAATKP